jgi:hypothetical protein
MLRSRADFTETMKSENTQYIVISTVQPTESEWLLPPSGKDSIRMYRESDNVKKFVLKQTFRKEKEKHQNEFLDLWIRKTVLVTAGLCFFFYFIFIIFFF